MRMPSKPGTFRSKGRNFPNLLENVTAISYLPAGIAVSPLIFTGLGGSSRVKHSKVPFTERSPIVLLSVNVFRISFSSITVSPQAFFKVIQVLQRTLREV